jgi:hypothetical protein
LHLKGKKIRNLASSSAISDAATKGYVDTLFERISFPAAPAVGRRVSKASEDFLTRSVGDSLFVKSDGTSVLSGGLDMGRYGIRNVRIILHLEVMLQRRAV